MHTAYITDLSLLLAGICPVPAVLDTRIHGIQLDSRLVKKGDLFIALSGAATDATEHVAEAIERGANAVLVEGQELNGKVHESGQAIEMYLPNLRAIVATLADRFFKLPSTDIKVIGVTGTNGKTSVTHYIAQMLNLSGVKTGVIGTLGYGVPGSESGLVPLERTTPNVVDVHRYLAALRAEGVECVAMEVSSHGLDQGRVERVEFYAAVLTNLTRDHLDYHGSMDTYAQAKRRLFEVSSLSFAVLNLDDPISEDFASVLAPGVRQIGYSSAGNDGADVSASLIDGADHIKADLIAPSGSLVLESSLVGKFNLDNLLASIAVCEGLGMGFQCVQKAAEVTAVTGRMEVMEKAGCPRVLVDYAHTPDALENLILAVRPHCKGRLHLMFGCGGDRDTGKRAEMARIAEKLADHIVVTDDNPRHEDPAVIVADILSGFIDASDVDVIHSRADAIESLIRKAAIDDMVVLAGKGHEQYQDVAGERLLFSDFDVAESVMGRLALGPEEVSND